MAFILALSCAAPTVERGRGGRGCLMCVLFFLILIYIYIYICDIPQPPFRLFGIRAFFGEAFWGVRFVVWLKSDWWFVVSCCCFDGEQTKME